jgi:hypothetical protein
MENPAFLNDARDRSGNPLSLLLPVLSGNVFVAFVALHTLDTILSVTRLPRASEAYH